MSTAAVEGSDVAVVEHLRGFPALKVTAEVVNFTRQLPLHTQACFCLVDLLSPGDPESADFTARVPAIPVDPASDEPGREYFLDHRVVLPYAAQRYLRFRLFLADSLDVPPETKPAAGSGAPVEFGRYTLDLSPFNVERKSLQARMKLKDAEAQETGFLRVKVKMSSQAMEPGDGRHRDTEQGSVSTFAHSAEGCAGPSVPVVRVHLTELLPDIRLSGAERVEVTVGDQVLRTEPGMQLRGLEFVFESDAAAPTQTVRCAVTFDKGRPGLTGMAPLPLFAAGTTSDIFLPLYTLDSSEPTCTAKLACTYETAPGSASGGRFTPYYEAAGATLRRKLSLRDPTTPMTCAVRGTWDDSELLAARLQTEVSLGPTTVPGTAGINVPALPTGLGVTIFAGVPHFREGLAGAAAAMDYRLSDLYLRLSMGFLAVDSGSLLPSCVSANYAISADVAYTGEQYVVLNLFERRREQVDRSLGCAAIDLSRFMEKRGNVMEAAVPFEGAEGCTLHIRFTKRNSLEGTTSAPAFALTDLDHRE